MSSTYSDTSVPVSRVTDETNGGKPGLSLRKSCQFCRSRKIRCSGQNICNACRERNIECSYGASGQKGRPRGPARTPSQDSSRFQSRAPTPCLEPSYSSNTPDGQSVYTVAANLDDKFHRLIGCPLGKPANASDQVLDTLANQISRGSFSTTTRPQISSNPPPLKALSYETLFFTLVPEVIEIVASRVGNFGCQQPESNRCRYFARLFLVDKTTSMFSPSFKEDGFSSGVDQSMKLSDSPLEEINSHLTAQLLDIWFSQHPLTFMLAKTLLLRDIRNGTYDEILVSVMLADVQYAQGNALSRDKGERLFRWATCKLQEVSQSTVRLSTIQAVILLGWRCLSLGNARRAICYFVWAGEALNLLPTPQPGVHSINGIDVGEIQQESHRNACCLVFSIKLWALLQLNITGCQQVPLSAPPFIVSHENSSESFKLDRTSHNLATLQNQERMYRELCLLSHVSATAAHILAIPLPREELSDVGFLQSHKWQTNDIPGELSTQIRSVLLNLISSIKPHSQYDYLNGLTLCALHTLFIPCLFPPSCFDVYGSTRDRTLETASICQPIIDFCSSAKSLLQIFSVHEDSEQEGSSPGRILISQHFSSRNDLFALALDSCGRGMNSIYLHGQNGTEIDRNCIRESAPELARLATELHAFSKELNFINTTRPKGIKKLLKNAICQFSNSQMDFSDSYTSASTSSRAGSMGIPELELNAAFDNTDFSFGYDHASTSLAGIEGDGFYGYGLPILHDDMGMGWGSDANVHDMRRGGVRQ